MEGIGDNRVRLRMPPDFMNVTALCRDLYEVFGAHVDLVIDDNANSCVVFEAILPRSRAEITQDNNALDLPRQAEGGSYSAWLVAPLAICASMFYMNGVLSRAVFNSSI